jgi:hypothetical protein
MVLPKAPLTPFPTFGYFGPQYFCDREEELKALDIAFSGNIPILLTGIRRLGKTGLLHHFLNYRKKNQAGVFVDLLDAHDMRSLVSKLSEAILRAFPEETKYKVIWETIKKLRPMISFDEFSGLPTVSLNISSDREAEKSMTYLLDSVASRPEQTVLIFYEFQQVIQFEDSHVESIIRSEMQRHPQIHYIFSGSKTHMLSRVFQDSTRPFYGMVQSLHLEKLDPSRYHAFIISKFSEAGKTTEDRLVEKVLDWTDRHTYYTQYVCNQLFQSTGKEIVAEDLAELQERIMKSFSQDFFQIKDLLSKGQWKTLVAVSVEQKLDKPFSQRIAKTYDLGNSNAVRKAIDVLLDKQLIHLQYDASGHKFYQPSNPFLANWIRRK